MLRIAMTKAQSLTEVIIVIWPTGYEVTLMSDEYTALEHNVPGKSSS